MTELRSERAPLTKFQERNLTMLSMSRWRVPRSVGGRLAFQVVLLVLAAGVVYLVTLWLGSDLTGTSGSDVNAAL